MDIVPLPTSTHRDNPQFRYTHIGRQDKIAILDELYDILIELLSGGLIQKNKTNYENSGRRIKTFANFGAVNAWS